MHTLATKQFAVLADVLGSCHSRVVIVDFRYPKVQMGHDLTKGAQENCQRTDEVLGQLDFALCVFTICSQPFHSPSAEVLQLTGNSACLALKQKHGL